MWDIACMAVSSPIGGQGPPPRAFAENLCQKPTFTLFLGAQGMRWIGNQTSLSHRLDDAFSMETPQDHMGSGI